MRPRHPRESSFQHRGNGSAHQSLAGHDCSRNQSHAPQMVHIAFKQVNVLQQADICSTHQSLARRRCSQDQSHAPGGAASLEAVGADLPSPVVLQEGRCCCVGTLHLQDELCGQAGAGPNWVGRDPDGMILPLVSAVRLLQSGLLRCGYSLRCAAAAVAAAVPHPGCATEVGIHHQGFLQQGRVALLNGELLGGGCLHQGRSSGKKSSRTSKGSKVGCQSTFMQTGGAFATCCLQTDRSIPGVQDVLWGYTTFVGMSQEHHIIRVSGAGLDLLGPSGGGGGCKGPCLTGLSKNISYVEGLVVFWVILFSRTPPCSGCKQQKEGCVAQAVVT